MDYVKLKQHYPAKEKTKINRVKKETAYKMDENSLPNLTLQKPSSKNNGPIVNQTDNSQKNTMVNNFLKMFNTWAMRKIKTAFNEVGNASQKLI